MSTTMADDEDLAKRTSSWTLACDNDLLNKLKSSSKRLQAFAAETLEEVEAVIQGCGQVSCKLESAHVGLLLVSNTAFTEQRVQDFDVSSVQGDDSPTPWSSGTVKGTKGRQEARLREQMKEAIHRGIAASKENASREAESLVLPYLIGSPKYFSTPYLGLVGNNDGERGRMKEESLQSDVVISRDDKSPTPDSSIHSTATPSPNPVPKHQEKDDDVDQSYNQSFRPKEPALRGSKNDSAFPPPQMQPSIVPSRALDKNRNPEVFPGFNKLPDHPPVLFPTRNDGSPPPVDPEWDNDSFGSDDNLNLPRGTTLPRDHLDDDVDIFSDTSLFAPPKSRTTDLFGSSGSDFLGWGQPPPFSLSSSNDVPPPLSSNTLIPQSDNNKVPELGENKSDADDSVVGATKAAATKKAHKIPPGGVSIFGSLPPAEVAKLRTQKSKEKKEAKEEENLASPDATNVVVAKHHKPSSHTVTTAEKTDAERVSSNSGRSTSLWEPVLGVDSKRDIASKRVSSGVSGSTNVRKDKPKIKSLFDESDSDDDIFSSLKTQSSAKPATSIISAKPSFLDRKFVNMTDDFMDNIFADDVQKKGSSEDDANVLGVSNEPPKEKENAPVAVVPSQPETTEENEKTLSDKSSAKELTQEAETPSSVSPSLESIIKDTNVVTSEEKTDEVQVQSKTQSQLAKSPPTTSQVDNKKDLGIKVNVKQLASGLKFPNPMAMGGRPPPKTIKKQEDEAATVKKQEDEENPLEGVGGAAAASHAPKKYTENRHDSLLSSSNNNENTHIGPLLQSNTKHRAKVNWKRKPPSKKHLHAFNKSESETPSNEDEKEANRQEESKPENKSSPPLFSEDVTPDEPVVVEVPKFDEETRSNVEELFPEKPKVGNSDTSMIAAGIASPSTDLPPATPSVPTATVNRDPLSMSKSQFEHLDEVEDIFNPPKVTERHDSLKTIDTTTAPFLEAQKVEEPLGCNSDKEDTPATVTNTEDNEDKVHLSPPPIKKGLFDSDSDSDELWMGGARKSKEPKPTAKSEEKQESLFKSTKTKSKPGRNHQKSLFDDSSDDDDLFATKPL